MWNHQITKCAHYTWAHLVIAHAYLCTCAITKCDCITLYCDCAITQVNSCISTQVRDQQRLIALKIRRAVEERREHELEQLGKELRDEWERQQREKINTLQKLYHESLQLLGQGQRSAKENVRRC